MEQLRVQWTEFPASLTGALGQLQHAGELADVTLACEGRRIHAHKLVLSACSPYFRDAFKENPCHHPIIILKDVQAQDILYLLSYMYQGEVNVEENKLSSFIQTAELLQIKGLTAGIATQAMTKKPVHISNQHKKSSATSGASSKKAPSLVHPANIPTGKVALVTQKRRRNSAGEKLSDSNTDPSKKIKTAKEKLNSKKNAASPTDNSKQVESSPKGDNENTETTPICEPASPVEIKHEVLEYSDTEMPIEEMNASDDDTPPSSPTPFYETSMLARSLLSGAQALKNDNPAPVSTNKSKLATQSSSNAPSQNLNSKSNIPVDETLVKTEKLSPRSDVMELEPEVLISEQDESLPATVRPLLGPKNNIQTTPRTDQVGASTSQGTFNQTNHAAICGDCPHCGTQYSNQSALKYHVRLMHSDLTNRLCCYLCPRSFTIRDTFKEHMWTSHGQRN